MNIKVSAQYQLWEYKKSVIIYYIVIFSVLIFFSIMSIIDPQGGFNSQGFDMSTIIFIFILGLNSFKEAFLLLQQNGISRKTMICGRIISLITVSFGMAVIDQIISAIFRWIEIDGLHISNMYNLVYAGYSSKVGTFVGFLTSFLMMALLYLAAASVGYLITALYYRMNKGLKVLVSVSVPVGLMFVLPVLDLALFDGMLMAKISKIMVFFTGVEKQNPFILIASCTVASVLFLTLSWLLIRRAVDKE